jgi:hypothetical protein
VLGPSETKSVELLLRIPDDESLFGKRFQAHFWSHTLPRPGVTVNYGLTSRVVFTVASEREAAGAAPVGDLSLTLAPEEVRLAHVAPGKRYRFDELPGGGLTVRNTSAREVTVELAVVSPERSATGVSPGYTNLLDCADVRIDADRITLAPGEERAIPGSVQFAAAKPEGGMPLLCVVSAAVTDLPVRTQIYSRIVASYD